MDSATAGKFERKFGNEQKESKETQNELNTPSKKVAVVAHAQHLERPEGRCPVMQYRVLTTPCADFGRLTFQGRVF